MNFEAVPCMLRTGADGSSVYGLLIRPSPGVVQQQLQPQSAVILQQPSTSGQQPARALQLVPSGTIQQQPIAPAPPSSSGNNKILLPNVSSCSAPMHLQLATAPLTAKFSSAPQVAVVQSLASYGGPVSTVAPAYSTPTVFDSPSPSQVVPQMSVSDGYEHPPVTSSVISTAQPTTQHVYMQPLMEQYDYAQQPLPSSSTASYPKPTASASIDVSGLELLDDLAPMDIARILAESESILSPDCPMLEGAVVDAHSGNPYNPMLQQHDEQQASCSSSLQPYSVQQHHQQLEQSSSRTPLNIQISCQQQQQQQMYAAGGGDMRMPACRYVPQPQLQQQQQQQQQFRPAPGRRHAAPAPLLSGIRPALRPQLDWEQGPNDSSGTPDSGIQSIAGSPPSNGVYTPPLVSPSLRNNNGHQPRRSSGPTQISPPARTSSLARPPPCLPATGNRTTFDSNQCPVDERPTSSSSSATTTTKERTHNKSTKRLRRRKKRKGEFADMPRLFPAFRTTADSSLQQHDDQVYDEEVTNVPMPVNVGDKLSQMEAKFDQVCSRLDSALDKRSGGICSPTMVSTELGSPSATNTSPSTASGPPSTSISLDCEDPTALAERLLSLKPDLIEQVASIIQSKTKCKDEQSAVCVSSSSGKQKPRKSRRASSSVQSPSADSTSDEKKKLMLDRLLQYRQKARRIVDTRLLEHIIDLSAQLRIIHISSDDQSLLNVYPKKSNWFSVNLEKAAERIARRKRPASPEIGLENEADSSEEDGAVASSSKLVFINEHPQRISLKIKRGTLINAEESTAIPPKKRPNSEAQDVEAEARRAKKRRKKVMNPWDRKPAKKQKESPIVAEDDGPKSARSPKHVAGTSKDMTGNGPDTSCKVVLRRLSDERQLNDSFCVVSSADSQGDNHSSPGRKSSLKTGQSKSSPTKYESEGCKVLQFDGDALKKCCQVFGRDFHLPNNWMERRPLASSAVRKSSKDYRKIRSNIYVDQPPRDEDKQQACTCPAGAICADDCLNRMMFVECTAGWCPCDDTCTNRRFQRHQCSPFAEKYETTDGRGSGVRASGRITAGTFIFEYVGEVVTTERFAERMSTLYREDRHHYGLDLCAGFIIDSYRVGNIARFVNHSCEPNCQMQKWSINGQYRVGLFALRDLEPGEELTYDYKFAAFEDDQVCTCGSAKCRGTISAARSKSSVDNSPPKGWQPRSLSHRERSYVAKHRIFLLRCFDRNYKKRFGGTAANANQQTPIKRPDMGKMIRTHLTALDTSSRIVQTRRLSVALEDECFLTLARLAQVLNQIYSAVANAKDDCGQAIVHNGRKAKFAELSGIKEMILTGQFETPEKFDIAIKAVLEKVQKSLADSKKSQAVMAAFSNAKRDCAEQLRDVLGYDLSSSFLEQTPPTTPKRQRKETARAGDLIPTQTDLSYMDDGCAVGSYDPDDATGVWAPTANEGPGPEADNVRCICGMFEEEGVMVQCDRCLYWLHSDCVHPPDGDDDYICEFCTSKQVKAPAVDILLRPQPDVKLAGCVYYRTLVSNNELQVRLNETVYVKRLIDDHHKAILKKLHQQCVQKSEPLEEPDVDEGPPVLTPISDQQATKSENVARERPSLFVEYQRKDLRVFRVERLFKGPNGQRFVFGCYYARPHETFCEPTRMFCRNELFWTPLFDTLPLDAVVGRCLVLEPSVWCKGRPRLPKYREDDTFICEYRVDKSQRFFEKIAQKNRYYINTERYIFDNFEERLRIKRNFTPFIMPGGTGEQPVKIVAESDDEDLVPLGVIRLNLQKRKRAQMMQRLEKIVQSMTQQNM